MSNLKETFSKAWNQEIISSPDKGAWDTSFMSTLTTEELVQGLICLPVLLASLIKNTLLVIALILNAGLVALWTLGVFGFKTLMTK